MTPLELVAHVTEGLPVSAAELDSFIQEHPKEGQHLDYKSGLLATDPDGNAKLCRHITGLANVAGGVLIVGVRDDRAIDGVGAKGGRGAKGWAENTVSGLATFFSPPPHFSEVDHPQGTVLIVAVHRNSRLIPVTTKGQVLYHLRLGDQTLKAPEHLVTDLLLGRRERPIIDLRVEKGEVRDTANGYSYWLNVDLVNEGAIWIEEALVGMIGWHVYRRDEAKEKLPNTIRASLNATPPAPASTWHQPEQIGLRRHAEYRGKVPPLSTQSAFHFGPLDLDAHKTQQGQLLYLKAAVFCVPRDGAIQWFQLSCCIGMTRYGGKPGSTLFASPAILEPVSNGELVEVAWKWIIPPQGGVNLGQNQDWEAMWRKQQTPATIPKLDLPPIIP